MPVRVKAKKEAPQPPVSPTPWTIVGDHEVQLPDIDHDDAFRVVVKKLSLYISDAVDSPSTFEQLRTTYAGEPLRRLVSHLSNNVTNPATINALLALRWHYGTDSENKGIGDARANACEIVAWRFLTRLSEREVVDFCLYEIPDESSDQPSPQDDEENAGLGVTEHTPLMGSPGTSTPDTRPGHARIGSMRRDELMQSVAKLTQSTSALEEDDSQNDPALLFVHLNALEIAAIADAKRFLSQHVVQNIITDIWTGRIVFWDRLSVQCEKKPRFYNANMSDPFSRLRVPKYLKAYEIMFFASFLALYYSVLIEQNRGHVTPLEILLYIWFAAFFYDELSEYLDAGSIFYAADVWNLFDIVMIIIGVVFAILRFTGLSTGDLELVDIAFDVLSLEALFMVPRVCSILSLSPYWGTLIPCLKEMGKDFLKFMVLVVILYLGFLTTFSLVGRSVFSFRHMAMIVTKIFFGNSSVGFEVMEDIDSIFGPPLMIIFVTLTSILLMGSLTGMLSNSFSRVITHAREEYLYVYSVYVLEASTSNRLTHFYPPFNLLALAIFRPLRLLLPSDNKFRLARILLLKATHFPIVAVIQVYEWLSAKLSAPRSGGSFAAPRRPAQDSLRRRSMAAIRATSASRPLSTQRPPSSQRPRSSTQQQQQRPSGLSSPRAPSATEVFKRPGIQALRQRQAEFEEADAPADVETRIAELSAKIDQLTALVTTLPVTAGIDTIRT